MRIISILTALILMCGGGQLMAQTRQVQTPRPTMSRMPFLAKPPIIDGVVDEQEWAPATRLLNFYNLGSQTIADGDLMVRVAYDAENLFFAFRVTIDFDPDCFDAKSSRLPHDSGSIFNVDCLDIRLSTERDRAKGIHTRQFALERGGGTYDSQISQGWTQFAASEWEPEWKSACRVTPGAFFASSIWEAEVAIPWKSIGMEMPHPQQSLDCQIIRYRGNTKTNPISRDARITTWAITSDYFSIMTTELYGTLVAGGDKPVLTSGAYRDFTSGTVKIAGTLSKPAAKAAQKIRVWASTYEDVRLEQSMPVTGKNFSFERPMETAQAEKAMMSWALTDEAGSIAGTTALTMLRPAWYVQYAPIYSQKKLSILQEDLGRLHLKEDMTVALRVADTQGKMLDSRQVALPSGRSWFESEVSIAKLEPGAEGILHADLLNKDGTTRYRYSEKFKTVASPAWMNNDLGKVTEPPPGWVPVKVKDQGNTREYIMREQAFRFDTDQPLPRIILRGKDVTLEPVTVVAETAGGTQSFTTLEALKQIASDARGASLTWSGQSADLMLKANIRVEFDGMAWYTLECAPRNSGRVDIKHLALRLKLDPTAFRYMVGTGGGGAYYALVASAKVSKVLPKPEIPFHVDVSGDGWKFDSANSPYYWLGNEKSGFFFVRPSERNFAVKDKYTQVIDEQGKFEVDINLVQGHTLPADGPLNYEFGFFLTPTRQPVIDAAALHRIGSAHLGFNTDPRKTEAGPDFPRPSRVAESTMNVPWAHYYMQPKTPRDIPYDYMTTVMLPAWEFKQAMIGAPEPEPAQVDLIGKAVQGVKRSIGGSPMLWYDSLVTVDQLPQVQPIMYEIQRYPQQLFTAEQHCTTTCPTDTWADYYLFGAVNRMKQGVESFYMDMSDLGPCSNRFHGHGYRDKDGKLHGAVPFLESREFFLRYQNLVKRNNPRGLLVLHNGNPCSPISLWQDALWSGEEWTVAKDYSTLSPELYQLVYMATDKIGAQSLHFSGLIYRYYAQVAKNSGVHQAEVFGLTLLHNEYMVSHSIDIPGCQMLWNAVETFGTDRPETQWIPYWRNGHSEYPGPSGVAVSSYRRGNREMLVVFNTAYESRTYSLDRFKGRVIRDAMNEDEIIPSAPVNLEPRGFRLLTVD